MMNKLYPIIRLFLSIALFLFAFLSTSFSAKITWQVADQGGIEGNSKSGKYKLLDASGQVAIGVETGTNFKLSSGYILPDTITKDVDIKVLDVPTYDQANFGHGCTGDCSPTAAAMILGWYDSHGWPRMVPEGSADYSKNPKGVRHLVMDLWKTMEYTCYDGTNIEKVAPGIIATASNMDPGAKFVNHSFLEITNSNKDSAFKILKGYIDNNWPVLFSSYKGLKYYFVHDNSLGTLSAGHSMVMTGYQDDGVKRKIFLNSGWGSPYDKLWVNYDDLGIDLGKTDPKQIWITCVIPGGEASIDITINSITLYKSDRSNSCSAKQEWDHLYKKGDTLYIEAKGIGGNPNIQDKITVKISSSVTNLTGILTRLIETSSNSDTYCGTLRIDQELVNTSEGAEKDEIAVLELEGDIDPDDSASRTVGEVFLSKFPKNWKNSSIARGAGSETTIPPIPPCNKEFVKAGGFEIITIDVGGNYKPAYAFVKNQADLLVYIGHGSSKDGAIMVYPKVKGADVSWEYSHCTPENIGSSWSEDVDTAILFASSVLCVNDNAFNNNYPDEHNDDPNPTPGKKWVDKVMGASGPNYLLGFNYMAPTTVVDKKGKDQKGRDILYNWVKEYGRGNKPIDAWEKATKQGLCKQPFNACAIDKEKDYYYWKINWKLEIGN